jgi:HD superfamily phosphohydrolase
MPKYSNQRIQDSVHGLMEFHGMENVVIEVLRTPEIQRLRRIRQLGLAHFVFPGAEHSRFVHSLGASHLAIRFCKQLKDTQGSNLYKSFVPDVESICDLAVGALCHDLGHGPLSHMWEREIIGEDYDDKKWIKALYLDENDFIKKPKWHELISQAFLNWGDGQLHQLLEKHEVGFSKRLRQLLLGNYYIPYLPRLISSDIDVDRCDFIKRDTLMTGVAYGRYDLDWLISASTVGKYNGKLVFGFDERKAIRVIEQFLIARRALYDTVYYHKTVRCAEGMAGLFLSKLKEVIQNKGFEIARSNTLLRPVVKIVSGEPLKFEELLSLDDYYLWSLIDVVTKMENTDNALKDLGQRIISRNLFKIVPCSSQKVNDFLRKPDGRKKILEAIKPYCPQGNEQFYLVVDEKKFNMFSENESDLGFIIDSDGKAIAIKDHVSFGSIRQLQSDEVRIFTLSEAVQDVCKLIN